MKETEITVEVLEDLSSLSDKLEKHGFVLTEEVDMRDYYISKFSSEQLLKMQYAEVIKNSFLIRECRGRSELIFKNKEFDIFGNVIAEEKFHCDIKNTDDAVKIFKLANLNVWCELMQHMLIYKREDMVFLVQQVEDLGTFIEYEEDEGMSGLTEQEKINLMLNNLKSLDLKIGDDFNCKKVYLKFKKLFNN